MLTLCISSHAYSLQEARRLSKSERAAYLPEHRDSMMIGTSDAVALDNVDFMQLNKFLCDRQPDGEFPGSANLAYIITPEEWTELIAMDRRNAEAAAAKQQAEEIAALECAKRSAEAQMKDGKLPTKAEANAKLQSWNRLQNEGGYGYIPHYYSDEEYSKICTRLAELKG